MYKKAEASFWTAEELDLAHDAKVSRRRAGLRGARRAKRGRREMETVLGD